MATGLHTLVPWLQPYAVNLVNIAAAAGLSPRVSSARRSHSQQALLYRRFLAGQSRFPAAPPGNSAHELGLAFDLWINDEDQLGDLGTVWEGWGGTWGGRFRDPIHFEGPRDSADSPALADDPGIPQSRFVDELNAIQNDATFLASLGLPLPLSVASDVAQAFPQADNPIIENVRKSLFDPLSTSLDPLHALQAPFTNLYRRWFK